MNDKDSKPQRLWAGEYGEEWTEDNYKSVSESNEIFKERFGISKPEHLQRFFGDVPKDSHILEVGTNIGTQLMCLRELGFHNLYGIDIQRKAIEKAHHHRPELDIIEGDLFDIPFKNDYFDLVFTNGVLIHVPPKRIDEAVDELVRCSNKWVYGHEFYADTYTEITHRGHDNVLWKTDFPSKFVEGREIELTDIEYLKHTDSENVDVAYRLKIS
jgi:pseudaminic acid biosynthesis-associated methylase